MSLKIEVRTDEISYVGTVTINALKTNLKDFTALDPNINQKFVDDLTTLNNEVDQLTNPRKLIGELSIITQRIYATQDKIPDPLNKLEYYVKKATNLSIPVASFGIAQVRKSNSRGDIEGLSKDLQFVTDNAAANLVTLKTAGYTDALQATLVGIVASLKKDNADQAAKEEEKETLVSANNAKMQQLWDTLQKVWEAGKVLYKKSDPIKVKSFTLSSIKSAMRNEQLKSELSGKVLFGSNPLSKVKIIAKPIGKGRSKTVYSNDQGEYSLKGLPSGDWIISFSLKGYGASSASATVERAKKSSIADTVLTKI